MGSKFSIHSLYTNAEGKGPAWANSLFEDNAEFGFGMYLAVKQIRERLADLMQMAVNSDIDEKVKNAFREWLDNKDEINDSNTDVLLVALGAPKQEKWIHANKEKLKVKVCIGVAALLMYLRAVQNVLRFSFKSTV